MKVRTKYLLFVITLHLVALVLSFFIFRDQKILFIVSEIIVFLSALLAWRLYQELLLPLKTLMSGIDAISDRDFNVKFMLTGKYEMDQLINVYNQMMDELRMERIRQEEQHFFLERLINSSPTGIIIMDYDDRIHQMNPKAMQILGLDPDESPAPDLSSLSHPILDQIRLLPPGDSITISIHGISTYKLQKSQFVDRGFQRRFVMIEELTAEILAAEKKVYGKVIRMMAHEVNNTIGPVNSILHSALREEELWENANHEILHSALQVAMERNQNLNVFMRNFADLVKLPEPTKRELNLLKLIHNVGSLMESKAREKEIILLYELPADRYLIKADEQQLEQVLINIVKNAIEAIGETGRIIFTVDPRAGTLSIRDTGPGIPEGYEGQLFSPFFSTKKGGQGIGLTLVREILLNHGFEFSLKTIEPGKTEFLIRF